MLTWAVWRIDNSKMISNWFSGKLWKGPLSFLYTWFSSAGVFTSNWTCFLFSSSFSLLPLPQLPGTDVRQWHRSSGPGLPEDAEDQPHALHRRPVSHFTSLDVTVSDVAPLLCSIWTLRTCIHEVPADLIELNHVLFHLYFSLESCSDF